MSLTFEVRHGDCLELMRAMPDNSVDAVVTDPPYGLSFMGKKWDYDVPSVEVWAECLRVLKPGGHLLAFAGTRTQHRMAVRIEDAGFEIRDMIAWVYGSGFPKSRNVCLDMDKMDGHGNRGHRIAVANRHHPDGTLEPNGEHLPAYEPKTDAAKQWQGWGTALKPALEPITMARKPLAGTVAENVLDHGTGAINVDGCRVELETDCRLLKGGTYGGNRGSDKGTSMFGTNTKGLGYQVPSANGRWPANLIHDGSEEVLGCFPDTKGGTAVRRNGGGNTFGGDNPKPPMDDMGYGDNGSAARFFYCAKASKRDRDEGLDGFELRSSYMVENGSTGENLENNDGANRGARTTVHRNHHPTVKPTALMRYLVRLVTPPGGTVLDPFTGSGSTGKGAKLEGFNFIGIEREAEYVEIASARIEAAKTEAKADDGQLDLFALNGSSQTFGW